MMTASPRRSALDEQRLIETHVDLDYDRYGGRANARLSATMPARADALTDHALRVVPHDEGEQMSLSTEDIQALSADERLRLISVLWDSLVEAPDEVPITDVQRSELDRRLDRYQRGLTQLHSWEEVRARIERNE